MNTNPSYDCVQVDEYELQWAVACLCELTKEGKLTTQENVNLIEDLLENS